MKPLALIPAASLVLAAIIFQPTAAQNDVDHILIPMGGGYSDLYTGMLQTIVKNDRDGLVNILVLPSAYSSNPISITEGERQTDLRDAETRRFEVQEACKRAVPQNVTCSAVLAPVFTRDDASAPATLDLLAGPWSAVFLLGGDQTVAMQAILGTPLETRLEELYADGTIFSGTSAGCGMQSYNMLGGYSANFAAGNALTFGAADVWNQPNRHGLTFGVQNAILDQHFFQRSRFARLLNAITLPNVPHIGIGVDGYTALHIYDGHRLGDVFGLYDVAVLDAETYHAAEGARYVPLSNDPHTHILSVRNVLVHLLAQGDHTYDLDTRQHSLGAPSPQIERNFNALALPAGAGTLTLSGYFGKDPAQSVALTRFAESGNGSAERRVLIVAAGFPSERSAQTNAESVAEVLSIPTEIVTLGVESPPVQIPDSVTDIIVLARDASKVNVQSLAPIREAWLAGMPVLAENAAAAVMGDFYSNHGPTPDESDLAEIATQKSFLAGITDVQPGLGLMNILIEPRLSDDNRWGRWFSVAHAHPEFIAIGLNDNTALEITAEGATVVGDDGIFVLDLRVAELGLGTNNGYVIANGLLDVFAPGERVQATTADVNARFDRQPIPVISTPTPVPSPTSTSSSDAVTASPVPTQPPAAESTPAQPSSFMIGLAVAGLLVWVLSSWLLKRRRAEP